MGHLKNNLSIVLKQEYPDIRNIAQGLENAYKETEQPFHATSTHKDLSVHILILHVNNFS